MRQSSPASNYLTDAARRRIGPATIRLRALPKGNHLAVICLVVASVFAVSGIAAITRGLQDQRSVSHSRSIGDIPEASSRRTSDGLFTSFARPTSLSIPAVGITSDLTTVGKTATGGIDTPKAPDFDKAAWYHDSPSPGQYGASVIVGHVDSYANGDGPSVFYALHKVKTGDQVTVSRDDGSTVTFKVYAMREYGREKVPPQQVYDPHTGNAELRLITCSGTFDTASGEYTDNTVVFASMTSLTPAPDLSAKPS